MLTESNPLGGVEAALSAFDAQATGRLFWNVNDRPNNTLINQIIQQFQVPSFQQTTTTFSYELAKQTATGARFAARHNIGYDLTNTPNRLFSSAYTGWFEAEYRQPLMFGAGADINRIAGPNASVGQYNGVLIACINTDISLADFEQGVINFTNDIETAYWELHFAYHNLDIDRCWPQQCVTDLATSQGATESGDVRRRCGGCGPSQLKLLLVRRQCP